jgi:hypothetical protein
LGVARKAFALKGIFADGKQCTSTKIPGGKMIAKTRKMHGIIWLTIAILLPILFAASIIYRHSEPVNQKIPLATHKK